MTRGQYSACIQKLLILLHFTAPNYYKMKIVNLYLKVFKILKSELDICPISILFSFEFEEYRLK